MIERATDASFLNRVLNDPDVRPWVADLGEGELDLSAIVENRQNIVLQGEYGAFVLFKIFEGCWEVHTAVLPMRPRGWTQRFAYAGAKEMFCGTDAVELLTRVPEGHQSASQLTKSMGFALEGVTLPETLFRGNRVPVSVYRLTMQNWAAEIAHAELEEYGAKFHTWINSVVSGGEPHPADLFHNRVVGATLEMAMRGQLRKAVMWYNRTAFTMRHRFISLLSEDPPTIRFDAGILSIKDGQLHYHPAH